MSPEQASGERSSGSSHRHLQPGRGRLRDAGRSAAARRRHRRCVLTRKLREPASSLATCATACPVAVDDAIRRALAKVPANRFSTARQFADALAPGADVATSRAVDPSADLPARRADASARTDGGEVTTRDGCRADRRARRRRWVRRSSGFSVGMPMRDGSRTTRCRRSNGIWTSRISNRHSRSRTKSSGGVRIVANWRSCGRDSRGR